MYHGLKMTVEEWNETINDLTQRIDLLKKGTQLGDREIVNLTRDLQKMTRKLYKNWLIA